MGLAKRVIPTLLVRALTLIKGVAFESWRSVGVAQQAVRIHQARGVDELVLLDIAATAEGRGPDLTLIEELAEVCFMPLTVGGGVKTVRDVRALLMAGADKVLIGTQAYLDPLLPVKVAHAVGRQVLVVAIDVKDDKVWIKSGKQKTEADPLRYANQLNANGAGEILLTSIAREGKMEGYDLDLIQRVSQAVDIPVVAAGGAGTYEHMYEAIQSGADGVAAGAMFLFTDATPQGAAEYLAAKGIEVRQPEGGDHGTDQTDWNRTP